MRPLPGDDVFEGRSRTTSFTDNDITPLATRNQPPQMTYFLTDENSIGESQSSSPSNHPKPRENLKNSSYGVESLETTISSLSEDNEDHNNELRKARRNWKKNLAHDISTESEDLGDSESHSSDDISRNASPTYQRRSSQATISRPFTPLSFGSHAPTSLIGSPDSRKNSEAGSYMDDYASQAIISSGEEDGQTAPEMMDSGSAPQLVMPSIKMPSRRPFTENGKHMGRLKVLIAGDSGVGKTSLIKAIVQICEDIVHVDPLSTAPIAIPASRRKSSKSKSRSGSTDMQATLQVTEVYASTRAYPAWWSDLEESRILRPRRKSLGDSVLERNLCFVDTPGYGNKTSCLESITPVVDYIESQLHKAASGADVSDSDMVSMLSGNGGTQVDLIFYVFSQRVKPVDIEYLKRLSHLTNIIPLISRADVLSVDQLALLKENIMSELLSNNIRPFLFGLGADDCNESHPSAPYAISTNPSKDEETMDASLLMSPDYIQPLLSSELSYLVSQVFSHDTISWLRHSAAKKFIQWRASLSDPLSKPQSLYRPLSSSQSQSLIPSTSQILKSPMGATTSYALAKITDHTQREERIAQVRLANWAADLQRSLQNERARFESLARSERAVWLTERLGECVQDGTIVPLSQARESSFANDSGSLVKQGTYSRRKRHRTAEHAFGEGVNPHDPLGLLQLNEEMKKRAWFALRLVGGVGIFGGIAYLFTKGWQTEVEAESGTLEWLGTFNVW